MSAVPQQSISVSNAEFLSAIFAEAALDAHVTGFEQPPDAIPNDQRGLCWAGRRFKGRDLNPEHNNYFTISTFSMLNDNGRMRAVRRKAQFLAGHCVVVDDVGKKVKRDDPRLPPPSWRLQTSPGNEQWGYILDKPCTDGALFSGTLALMVKEGLAVDGKDPGMKGVTRYVRLPVGVNRKTSYGDLGVACRMIEWEPTRSYSIPRLLAEFGKTEDDARALAEGVGTTGRVAAPANDTKLRALEQAGLYRRPIAGKLGWHEIECPWLEEHSDGDDSGTGVFVGEGKYGFKCHHGHCEHKTFNDLAQWLQANDYTGLTEARTRGRVVRLSDFMAQLEAPRWIFFRILQRGYLYSLTARWGHAKTAVMLYAAVCAALGIDFAGHQTERTRVLYLAGENPSDIRVRVALLLRDFGIEADDLDKWLFFTERSFTLTAEEQVAAILKDAHAEAKDFGLVIVDTGAAHSEMDEENSNTEMLQFAKAARRFLESLDGRPAVVCMMHPTKDANGLYALQPRGGGAFAAEIDGELVLWKDEKAPRATLHHQPKFRGPGFEAITFELAAIEMTDLLDNFGKPTVSVLAKPTDTPARTRSDVKVPGGKRQRAIWTALQDILDNPADHLDAIHENVRGVWGVPLQYLRAHTLSRLGMRLADDEKGNYKRSIESMIDGGELVSESINGERYVAFSFTPQTPQ